MIITSFKKLNCQYVAVRSSATTEDGKENAWAGQLDTFLYIDEKSIISAIKNAWKSLYGPRALYYGKKNNQLSNNSISIIVQKMINSTSSGIAFSINPINNNNNIVIEAIDGQGEAIVSGSVTPDIYEVNKENLNIISKTINNQKLKIIEKLKIIDDNNNFQKITDEKILELSSIIQKIENEYGYPVDVEWAIEDDILYILQARPITTNKPISKNTETLLNKVIDKKNWEFLWLREFSWFVENTEVYATTREYQNKFLGFDIATKNRLCINGDEYILADDSNYENDKLNKYCKDKNFLKDFIKKDFEIEKDTIDYIEYLQGKDFSSLTDTELIEEFQAFNEAYIKSFVPCVIIPEDYVHNKVIEQLKKVGFDENNVAKIISEVTKCPNHDKIYYNDEPLDLLKIALKKKNGDNIAKDIKQHIKEYGWLKDPCIVEDISFTEEEYNERINTLINLDIESRINEIYQVRKENDESINIAKDKYNLNGETIDLIGVLRDFTFLHTYTAQNTDHLFYTGRHTLFKEIEKRINISDNDIVSMGDNEILELLSKKINKETALKHVQDRKKGFAITWLDSKVYSVFGNEANYIASEVSSRYKVIKDGEYEESDSSIIKGNVANPGKVKGIAKILDDYEDVKKVNVGDIIIASMTTPIFVSAMEKASAFVTDEGGITCHAAIISREFGVPCIVGSICATKKIKDGDYIEVDAYKGEIRIINESKR